MGDPRYTGYTDAWVKKLIKDRFRSSLVEALKIDLETGEVILEPRDRGEEQLARACAALTSG
jgi:hypothetical protein